jgi:hypothetical protein
MEAILTKVRKHCRELNQGKKLLINIQSSTSPNRHKDPLNHFKASPGWDLPLSSRNLGGGGGGE